MNTTTKTKQDEEEGLVGWTGEILLSERAKLPNEPGLYCVYDGEQALYVGRSECLRRRWSGHNRLAEFKAIEAETGRQLAICWLEAGKGYHYVAANEQELIDHFKPSLNEKPAYGRLATATMHFRPDQLDWLQEEGLRRGVSSAAIVREAIDIIRSGRMRILEAVAKEAKQIAGYGDLEMKQGYHTEALLRMRRAVEALDAYMKEAQP